MKRLRTLARSVLNCWRVIGRFETRIRKELPLIGSSSLALFAVVALLLLEPWPLKLVLDQVFATGYLQRPLSIPLFGPLDPLILLIFAALGVVTIAGLRALAAYQSTVRFALLSNRVLTGLCGELFCHVESLKFSSRRDTNEGDSAGQVIGDVTVLEEVITTAIRPLLGNGLIIGALVTLMFWINRGMALVSLVIVPLSWLLAIRLWSRHCRVALEGQREECTVANTAAESREPLKFKQALSLEDSLARVSPNQNEKIPKVGVKTERSDILVERTLDVMIALSTAVVLSYGGWLVLRGVLTLGDLLIFLVYLRVTFTRAPALITYTGCLSRTLAAGERVLALLARTPKVRDLPNAIPAHSLQGVVAFEWVSFDYEAGHPVLRGIDFGVYPGNLVAIVGPSGSGKSTLVNLVLRHYDPEIGRVNIDGRDVREYTLASLRARIGVVRQDNLLFAASVEDNIAFGSNRGQGDEDRVERRLACQAAASLANAHDFISVLPQGYDTILEEGGLNLSASQRRRLAIARAAMRKSSLLILDEPTAGLAEADQSVVIEALARLARGRTTFLVTQDLRLAASADLILCMEGGRIVERGKHHELLRAGRQYAAMHGITSAKDEAGAREEIPALVP